MKENPRKIMEINIPRDNKVLENQRESINQFLKKNMVPDEIISSVELALYEAVINVIDHGSEEYKNSGIDITCLLSRKKITVTVKYEGEEFDLTSFKLPDIVSHYKAGKKRGLGIYFIRTLMDDVQYYHRNMKNAVTMVKHY